MATKIRLRRVGRRKQASFRIVVIDGSRSNVGRFTEQIGLYNPRTNPSFIEIDQGRALHWLRQGAQASDSVRSIFRRTGILQKFAEGQDGEGVLTIGDVDGRTIFPAHTEPAAPEPKKKEEPAAAAATEVVEEDEEVEEAEAAEEPEAEAATEAAEPEAEEAEEEAEEEEPAAKKEKKGKKEDEPKAEAGSDEEAEGSAEDDEEEGDEEE
jgi:small subunit ribosomal protein S16